MGGTVDCDCVGRLCRPQLSQGYDQRGDRCYRKGDAGADSGAEPDAQSNADDAGEDAAALAPRPCPDGCGEHASCDEQTEQCTCEPGYVDNGSECAVDPCEEAPACGEHEICKVEGDAATCACAPGFTSCEAACVDVMTDPMSCGSCGYQCETGLSSKQGECEQKIRELVLGADRSCAIYDSPDEAYPVKCWGDTSSKLFRDAAIEALTPRSIVGVPAVRGVALGEDFQCVVLPDRDVVRCWGHCEVGCGNSGAAVLSESFFESRVPGVGRIEAGSWGYSDAATCALNVGGALTCWGATPLIPAGIDHSSPVIFRPLERSMFMDVSLGKIHGCAVTWDTHVICWGTNAANSLGVLSSSLPTSTSEGVIVTKERGGELTGAVDVELAWRTACATTSLGELWCWGTFNALSGALGAGDIDEHVGAVKVDLSNVVDVALGVWHTCALVRGGQVYCWGLSPLVGLGEKLAVTPRTAQFSRGHSWFLA